MSGKNPVHFLVGIPDEVDGLAEESGSLPAEECVFLFPFGDVLYEFIEFRCKEDDVVFPLGDGFPDRGYLDSCIEMQTFV